MIKNYLRSALRNIARHPFISFINIFGLTVGLTCCLLILSYIINERSYDKFNKNAVNIYRVTRTFYSAPGVISLQLSSIAPPFGPLLQSAFPEIQKMTRVFPNGTTVLRYKEKLFDEKNAAFADDNFFSFFTVPVVKGDPLTGLSGPYSIMLTEAMAKKYFGDEDPINKTIILDNIKHGFKVTGIFKPFPVNSHMHPQILMSFSTLKDTAIYGGKALENNFGNNAFYTYLLLPPNYDASRLQARMPNFLDEYVHFSGTTKTHLVTSLTLQKLTDIHLRSHYDDEMEENGDIKHVYIFSAIALFILLIACINYMNLATARSVLRAKEIGIRKVIGAQQKEIIGQFLGESILICWVALLFAMFLTSLLLPLINKLAGQNLSLGGLFQLQILVPVLALPFVIGLISGIYPAIFMSSFKPVKVLKGMLKVGSGNVSFRKVLVVVQFSISIILIIATTVVYRQLKYIQNTDLGFDKEHIVTMKYVNNLNKQYDAFRDELLRNPAIKALGRSSRIPSGRLLDDQDAKILQGSTMQPVKVDIKCLATDYGFIPAYGMKLVAGRNFSKEFAADTTNFIINESAVQALGWKTPQNAIAKNIEYGGEKGRIIGVVKDFHFESLHQQIIPLLFGLDDHYNNLSMKIAGGSDVKSAMNTLQGVWHKYLPETPFNYTFLDEKFGQLYNSEEQQGKLFTIFSCIAIFIACLGLFGLSAFTITQRVKEIGVRKVLGASISQIVIELSKDFLKLVIIAAIIALPVAWFFMSKWLQDFAFRITISWWIFAFAGVIALIIAFVTISFQSVKAAMANPVKSLRSE